MIIWKIFEERERKKIFNMIQNKIFPRVNQHDLNENGHEMKRILNQEMSNALCMCFTGRISRLIDCVNGIDDLVVIDLSPDSYFCIKVRHEVHLSV